MHSENVDVVDEQAQWMTKNSSTPPTMNSHVLAMDFMPALFVHASPTDLGRSHGGTPHEEIKINEWRHAWRWSALGGCLYLDTSVTKLLLVLIR